MGYSYDTESSTANDLLALAVLLNQRDRVVRTALLIGCQSVLFTLNLIDPVGHQGERLILVVLPFLASQKVAEHVGQLFLSLGASQVVVVLHVVVNPESLGRCSRGRGSSFLFLFLLGLLRLISIFQRPGNANGSRTGP